MQKCHVLGLGIITKIVLVIHLDDNSIPDVSEKHYANKSTMTIIPTFPKCTRCIEKSKRIKNLQKRVTRLKIKSAKIQNNPGEEMEVSMLFQ